LGMFSCISGFFFLSEWATYRRERWSGRHQIGSCQVAAPLTPPRRGAAREKTGFRRNQYKISHSIESCDDRLSRRAYLLDHH
jgi:hypothetical protein